MTKTEEALSELAKTAIIETLHEGKKKHSPNEFLTHPDYHIDRAIRHLVTARLIRDGHQPADKEGTRGHLRRALTRVAMAIHQSD
jgi:hypothetical protein